MSEEGSTDGRPLNEGAVADRLGSGTINVDPAGTVNSDKPVLEHDAQTTPSGGGGVNSHASTTDSSSRSGSGGGSGSGDLHPTTASSTTQAVNTDKGDIILDNGSARIEPVASRSAASPAANEAGTWAGEDIEELASKASASAAAPSIVAAPLSIGASSTSTSTLSSAKMPPPKVHLDPLYPSEKPPEDDSPSLGGTKLPAKQDLTGEADPNGKGSLKLGTVDETGLVPPILDSVSSQGAATVTSQGAASASYAPGAFRVYPGGRQTSADDQSVSEGRVDPNNSTLPGTFSYVQQNFPSSSGEGAQNQREDQIQTADAPNPANAESQHLQDSNQLAIEAYPVEEQEQPPAATVVRTYFGIERKRLILLSSLGASLLVIVLAVVLGVLLPKTNNDGGTVGQEVCGPLCGPDSGVPDPTKEVYGHSCKDWNFNSTFLPAPHGSNGTCVDVYQSVAYGCGCPTVEIPPSGCGTLCQDGTELADPDLLVTDINSQELSCKDWELKAQFDADAKECVNYNAVGVLCGCPNNEPHPNSCGPLCGGDEFRHPGRHPVWDLSCDEWNVMSTYLPSWYNNELDQSCDDYYYDVSHGCSCPGQPDTVLECGTLCQENRVCSPICESGESDLPDPERIVRRNTCGGWEVQARLEVHSFVCPLYDMAGAHCGCNNTIPDDACGPLCGDAGGLPDPERFVQGETCEAWDYMATYLPSSYGKIEKGDGGLFGSCTDYFSGIAYGCGCPGFEPPSDGCGPLCNDGFEPPSDGCGPLCNDGASLPDPAAVVNARSCGDLELLSLHETDPKQCWRYEIFGSLCGCPTFDEVEEECFRLENLNNETYYFSSGGSLYSVSFGSDGFFAQIQSNNDLFMIGHYYGMDENDHLLASYGGGAACGLYGPRSGSVDIVEVEDLTEPTINYVIEPSICVYHAELLVPKFCTSNTTLHSSNATSSNTTGLMV